MALIKTDSGCKVGWEHYDSEEEARARGAEIRKPGGERDRAVAAGYDFGYQSPGEVERVRTYPHKTEDGKTDYSRPEFKDEWRVTTP